MTDLEIANRYLKRATNAAKRGVPFNLSFYGFKKLITRKKCAYSGVVMQLAIGEKQEWNTLTIDRVDSTKGYDDDNCVSCCYFLNELKGRFENPNNEMGLRDLFKGIKTMEGLLNGKA